LSMSSDGDPKLPKDVEVVEEETDG